MTKKRRHSLKYLLLIFGWILCSFYSMRAQESAMILEEWATDLTTKISKEGYQSVGVQIEDKTLQIYYENRVQRFEPRAMIALIQIIRASHLPLDIEQIQLVTQRLQLSLATTTFALNDLKNWEEGLITREAFVDKISVQQGGNPIGKTKTSNSGNYRLELELKPEIGLGLGGFPDPVIHRFFFVPTLNTYLWKGAQLQMELILPISSEFEIPGERFIRPGIFSFSQTVSLPKNTWLQGAVGYFSNNRYGGRLSFAKFWLNGSLSLTGRVGLTGYASYPKKLGLEKAIKGWEYDDPTYLDYNVGVNYWFKQWNTTVRVVYGKALFGKTQLKLTCLQRFQEVDIGFFAQKTQRGNNYGMQLNLPIAPKKYWKPKRLSVRPARSLNYTYQATQATVENYITGQSIINLHRHLNPEFIKNSLSSLSN